MKLKQTEKDIQNTILDWLRINKIFAYQNNSVGVYDPVRKIYRRNPAQIKGIPDITVVYKGRYIGIEVKSEKGKQSFDQMVFQKQLEDCGGGIYLLVRSVDEVIREFVRIEWELADKA